MAELFAARLERWQSITTTSSSIFPVLPMNRAKTTTDVLICASRTTAILVFGQLLGGMSINGTSGKSVNLTVPSRPRHPPHRGMLGNRFSQQTLLVRVSGPDDLDHLVRHPAGFVRHVVPQHDLMQRDEYFGQVVATANLFSRWKARVLWDRGCFPSFSDSRGRGGACG